MISYRPITPDDRQFVLSGWSASLRSTRDVAFISMADWATVMHPVISKCIDNSAVIVAAGSVLCGFIAYWPNYVMYCYVAQPFRRQGIARQLFTEAGIDPASRFCYAARTKASWECRAAIPLAHYDPYRARYPKDDTKQYENRPR